MTNTPSTRVSFVETFGEEAAVAIEAAASQHESPANSDQGSDPFRWAIVICLGYQCMEVDSYRKSHGIRPAWARLKKWIIQHGDIAHHDGGCDYLALLAGVYQNFIPKQEENDDRFTRPTQS